MTDSIVAAEVFVAAPGRAFVTLKITTADGIVGWGDATVNGRELAAASYLRDHLVPLLIGRDPGRIEDTWQYLYRGAYWRRGPITMAAIAAVDVALWDILGKRTRQPVYQLLGGRSRDGILCYSHAFGADLSHLLEAVDARREQGFAAIRAQTGIPGVDKVYGVATDPSYEPATRGLPVTEIWHTPAYLRHVPDVLAAVRDHVGPDLALLHDAHHRLTPTEAARFARAVEPADLFWLEDVTPAEDQSALRQVRAASTTPLAIGEVFNSVWDCQQLITERLIDYIRTSVVHAGGISHLRTIWALAAIYGVRGGPHGPSDVSPISFAASLHLSLAAHNAAIHEYMGYPDATLEVFDHGWSFSDGRLDLDDRPGLGVDYDERAAAGFEYQPAYLPTARSRDGAVTDW